MKKRRSKIPPAGRLRRVQAKAQRRRVRDNPKTEHARPAGPGLETEPAFLALDDARRTFVAEYLSNGFNATEAYLAAHPNVARNTAATEGWRNMRNPEIAAAIRPRLEARWKALHLTGDEVLARVGFDATVDLRLLYDEQGNLKKPQDWPEEMAGSVKSIQDGPYGLKVTFVDPLQARRIILEQTGKLRTPGDSIDALAKALQADLDKHGGGDD